jgi:hypothetical protein
VRLDFSGGSLAVVGFFWISGELCFLGLDGCFCVSPLTNENAVILPGHVVPRKTTEEGRQVEFTEAFNSAFLDWYDGLRDRLLHDSGEMDNIWLPWKRLSECLRKRPRARTIALHSTLKMI